jgi:pyruvate dehydrogenase E2 component (dihydrolipoamide acetyltransferase)
MPAEVIMPALGMAQESGTVVRWLKSEGDAVAKGEPLVEIETDKVTVELESPADGTLAGVRAGEGAEVPVGEAIAVVLAAGESLPAAAAPAVRSLASPKARRIAAARGVDLDALAGTGPGGAVLAADIESLEPTRSAEPPAVGSVWRLMAERTTASWQTVPQFVLRREVDATRLRSARADGVGYTDLLVGCVAEALRRHPRVNSSWQAGTIVPGAGINVAIAVAVDEGLVAPVIHRCDELDLPAIAARRSEIVSAAREGTLRPADLAGGTFTISNLGMYGVDSFDAIVSAPQAAILAVGRVVDRIVPVDGQPALRPMLQLSVTFDHRVVDGARGAEFLDTLASLVEERD